MRALIIDDQPLIVSGLQAVMAELRSPPTVSCAESPQVARRLLTSELRFDLVVLDLELEGAGGFDFLAELRDAHPTMSIVVLSASNSNDLVSRAIFLGAMGFVFKRSSNATLVEALQLVISGVVYVPPMKMRSQPPLSFTGWTRDTGWGAQLESGPPSAPAPLPTRSFASARGLTPRQTDVLELLLLGQPNKLIARTLNLSIDTVKDHVTSLLRTLNVTSRTQVVLAMSPLADATRHLLKASPFRGAAKRLTDD